MHACPACNSACNSECNSALHATLHATPVPDAPHRLPPCQRLLPQQPLRLPVQLLDVLLPQQAAVEDEQPLAHPVLHQAQPQQRRLLGRPAGGTATVPAAMQAGGRVGKGAYVQHRGSE